MFKHSTPFLERIARNLGSLFLIIFIFAAAALAVATTWDPGEAPAAAPGDGNVTLSEGQWIPSASDIYFSGGNVGIGTSTPATALEVTTGAIKATGGLIIETRTSDPASPADGQIWLRTDL